MQAIPSVEILLQQTELRRPVSGGGLLEAGTRHLSKIAKEKSMMHCLDLQLRCLAIIREFFFFSFGCDAWLVGFVSLPPPRTQGVERQPLSSDSG